MAVMDFSRRNYCRTCSALYNKGQRSSMAFEASQKRENKHVASRLKQRFFRHTPNTLLARQIAARMVFEKLDIAAMSETRHNELFAAYKAGLAGQPL
jgi:hypothetical protein